MASPYVRPDQSAFDELEQLLDHLVEELTVWRRRCLKAEAELANLKAPGGMVPGDDALRSRGRVLDLERENVDLRLRVDRAREMVLQLQDRLAFLDPDLSEHGT